MLRIFISMQIIFLAAGRGMRIRPLSDTTPKPLLLVAGVPILERNLNELPPEVDEIIIVVGYLGEQIKHRFGNSFAGRPVSYVEQTGLRGTADALWRTRTLLHEQSFLVGNGDDLYTNTDISRLIAAEPPAILVAKLSDARRVGVLREEPEGFLAGIEPPGAHTEGLVATGLYFLDQRIFEYEPAPIKDGAEFGLPQTIERMARDTPVRLVRTEVWRSITTPEDLQNAIAQ